MQDYQEYFTSRRKVCESILEELNRGGGDSAPSLFDQVEENESETPLLDHYRNKLNEQGWFDTDETIPDLALTQQWELESS